MIRVVLDTNVVVSGLLSPSGPPGQTIDLLTHRLIQIVYSDEVLIEYAHVLRRRELKILPEPPAVIVLLERRVDVWLAKWSGADGWLTQPIDPFELGRTAHDLIAEREQKGPRDAGLGSDDLAVLETEEAQTAGVERYPR